MTSAEAPIALARRTSDETEIYAGDLVDLYSATLLRIAWVISGDCTIASSTVVRVIVAAALDHSRLEPSRAMLFELSRLTMWASLAPASVNDSCLPRSGEAVRRTGVGGVLNSIPSRERALVALTLFGDHTYREASVVLGIAPELAANLLRSTLSAISDESTHPASRTHRPRPLRSTGEADRRLEPLPETREAMNEFMTHDGPEIDDVLTGLGQLARQLVPEVVGLSLGLVREGVTFTLVASNSGLGALDATQYLDGGPCVEVTEERQEVVQFDTDDPLDEGRWLLFAQTSAAVGVASSLSLPIRSNDQVVGGINLYASTADAFTGHHHQLGDALGATASEVVTNADLSFATRLRAMRAPATLRATQQVETATGLLAARYDRDLGWARARLRDAAARAGVDEVLVAQLIIVARSS